MESEKRLIDANDKHTINAVDLTGFILCFSGGIISVVDRFGHVVCEFYADDIPTVEAVEVVHGRWIRRKSSHSQTGFVDQCSVCQFALVHLGQKTNYCPNCGAKMDGDGNG